MKKFALNLSATTGRDAITAVLDKIQHGCSARTITIGDIDRICERVTKRLDITKAAMKGTTIWYTGAQHFPSAYKYTPSSTHFRAEYNGRTWIVTAIERDTCPNRYDNLTVTLSDSAKEAILKNHSLMII